jgi:hypothetical protein
MSDKATNSLYVKVLNLRKLAHAPDASSAEIIHFIVSHSGIDPEDRNPPPQQVTWTFRNLRRPSDARAQPSDRILTVLLHWALRTASAPFPLLLGSLSYLTLPHIAHTRFDPRVSRSFC